MKIYFCGSIRGGREDAALYAELIRYLNRYGTVLTEHIGSSALSETGGDGTNEYIWQRDTDWLKACDIVIAECTQTSLGVGYELGLADGLGKPVYALYRGDPQRFSAMVAGNPHFHCFLYREKSELPVIIDEIFAKKS